MARLFLKLDNVAQREYAISEGPVTIGRLPGNTVHIENLAVSGHHARIVREAEHWVLYDENSTNGIYVNGLKVTKAALESGDTILVGRHVLTFTDEPAAEAPTPVVQAPAPPVQAPKPAEPEPVKIRAKNEIPEPKATLMVMSGKTDKTEYLLTKDETVIGKSDSATVQLQRWFAPKVVATITKRQGKYFISESASAQPVRVNSQVVHGERELAAGDTILVDEVSLMFNLQ